MLKTVLQYCAITASALIIAACSQQEPVTLGFVGGSSGRVADLGVAGRNGFILAIEQKNAQGGLFGAPIKYLTRDDQQNKELVRKGVQELIDANVNAILGPMTSTMAIASVDLANQSRTLMMGITVTTNSLTGEDDYFFRTISPVKGHALVTARFLRSQGLDNAVAVIDLRNEAYTEHWANDFRDAFMEDGGTFLGIVQFHSSNELNFQELAEKTLEKKPSLVTLVMNSVDAALTATQLKKINPDIQITTSEWAGTERLIELGGNHVEGVYVPQYLDRESQEPAFRAFHSAYLERFGVKPGFPGMIAYNATNVVITALENRQDDQELKDVILTRKTFPGVQGEISFDKHGDANSITYMTQVTDGKFNLIGP